MKHQAASIKDKLERSLELLKLEKEEDFNQHKQFIQSLSLDERVKQGYSWYPLNILKSGYTYGERAFVIVERTSKLEEGHQFRSGKTANLFTQQPNVRNPERAGVVQYVEKNKLKIILNAKDLPDWLGLGLIGIDIMFDERTYLEMEKALKKVMEAGRDRLAELRAIFLGKELPKFSGESVLPTLPELNQSQNNAVGQIIASQDVAIIHGPPGTGKTTTLVQGVKMLIKTEHTVLVTAPSNTAVDLLTERLFNAGIQVVRIGNISRVEESLMQHTLDVQLLHHPESKNIKKMKKEAAELRRKAGRYKRKFGQEERSARARMYREAGELNGYANRLESNLIEQILDAAQVITCTLVGASSEVLSNLKFRTIIIDEAAQALEPASWIPILKASKVVLAGDPHQLPPTVKSREAQKGGFNVSLIERYLHSGKPSTLLRTQYRMNSLIMGFSNQEFYDKQLKADDSVADHQIHGPDNHPLVFIDTAGCGFEEKIEEKYQSRFNPEEAQILEEHLLLLLAEREVEDLPSIAVISPYRQQVIYLKQLIQDSTTLSRAPVTVNTIDGFQGQERDVVYISLVRSNEKGEIGFLSDTRRMNVAMTRAKKRLVVIGDSATIGSHPFYNGFLEYCERVGEYRTAWELMR